MIRLAFLLAGLLLGAAVTLLVEHRVFDRASAVSVVRQIWRRVSGRPPTAFDRDAPFTCWGDSLTAGYGASLNHDFPSLLANLFHRPVINEGVPSDTSTQIKARFLRRKRGEGPERVLIWAGRNNAWKPDDVIADVGAMVSDLAPGSLYLVLGVTSADLAPDQPGGDVERGISKINARLAAEHGPRFVATREGLLARANARVPEDLRDQADGIVPRSLRSDPVHLNDLGQAVVAMLVQDRLIANGW